MNRYFGVLAIAGVSFLFGCVNPEWDKHFNTPEETINTNVWDALKKDQDLTRFVQYMLEYQYDTLFLKDDCYTIFAPTNAAMTQHLALDSITAGYMAYHISNFFIQSGNIKGKRKVETLEKKFALFNNEGNRILFDDIPLEYESPLYINGKYFKMNQVAVPKPNLYEYIALTNPVLKDYIDSQDSLILDKELSRPIDLDEFGNTIYDSVTTRYNKFEEEFFPVSKEFRFQTATLVFPREEDYNNALTAMALELGGSFVDYRDISLDWQKKILIPYLLEYGVFENMVEPEEFKIETTRDTVKMKNILGDSIIIEYEPVDKTLCSNGYAYNYADFVVPDTLYASSTRFECEELLEEIGIDRFAWTDLVTLQSDVSYPPQRDLVPEASNDSILYVQFDKGYTGVFTLEFNIDNVFPRKYLMVFRTNTNVGGIYNIYVNDELVKTFDYYYYVQNKGVYRSVTGKRYPTVAGYNIFDCWVENLTEYGKTKITLEYSAPGRSLYNGLTLDYIDFVPASSLEE